MTLQQAQALKFAIACAEAKDLFPCSLTEVFDNLISDERFFAETLTSKLDKRIANDAITLLQAVKEEMEAI